jgi:hypothetical protein
VVAALNGQQHAFVMQAAGISAETASGLDDAVARHNDGHGISPVRRAHGPDRLGRFDLPRNIGVRARFAVRNLEQRIPDAALEIRSLEIER